MVPPSISEEELLDKMKDGILLLQVRTWVVCANNSDYRFVETGNCLLETSAISTSFKCFPIVIAFFSLLMKILQVDLHLVYALGCLKSIGIPVCGMEEGCLI